MDETDYVRNTPTRSYYPKKIKKKHSLMLSTNLITIKPIKNGPPASKLIFLCMVINARSLAKPQAASGPAVVKC